MNSEEMKKKINGNALYCFIVTINVSVSCVQS